MVEKKDPGRPKTSDIIPDSLSPETPKCAVALVNRVEEYRRQTKATLSSAKNPEEFEILLRDQANEYGVDPNASFEEIATVTKLKSFSIHREEVKSYFSEILNLSQNATWQQIKDSFISLLVFFISRECDMPEGTLIEDIKKALDDEKIEKKIQQEITNLFGVPAEAYLDVVNCIETGAKMEEGDPILH